MKVRIILDPEFGAQLRRIGKSTPVWIIQSATNNPVISSLRELNAGYDITSFQSQEFAELVDIVDLHNPGWLEMEVCGLAAEDGAHVFSEYGDCTITPLPNGFAVRRFSARRSRNSN